LLGSWIVAVIVATAAAHSAGTRYANDLSLRGTDSQRATEVLRRQFPAQAGDSDQIVFHTRSGTIGEANVRARVTQVLARVERLPRVTNVVSPYSPLAAANISADRRTALPSSVSTRVRRRYPPRRSTG
jgi:RND superfamily putative drug exporter